LPLFCRHNRYTVECPICSKGTVLDPQRKAARRPRSAGARGARATRQPAPQYRGPAATAGPYQDEEGTYELRLERVPGGLRFAAWQGGQIRRRAPVLPAADLPTLLAMAAEKAEAPELLAAIGPHPPVAGVSAGTAGELREELRVEPLEGERVRIARWILRPGSGWELQEAPVMLPAARFAEALRRASEGRVAGRH
jgi:hypothetical protein